MAAWRSKEEHVRKALHSMPGSQAFRAQVGTLACIRMMLLLLAA